jgi:hypothetical protein
VLESGREHPFAIGRSRVTGSVQSRADRGNAPAGDSAVRTTGGRLAVGKLMLNVAPAAGNGMDSMTFAKGAAAVFCVTGSVAVGTPRDGQDATGRNAIVWPYLA